VKLDALAAWQDRLVEGGALPCALTLVGHKGGAAFLHGSGWRDPAARVPLQADDVFRLYSMTKPITSVALMLLYEEGLFHLNDPVHLFLGERWKARNMVVFDRWRDGERGRKALDYSTRACEVDITVRHLLTHTAGLSYGFDASGRDICVDPVYGASLMRTSQEAAPALAADDVSMLRAFCDSLAGLPLWFQPGSHWNYSHATDVCGRLIEVLSGQPLDRFLRERVFEPLGMRDTGFEVPAQDEVRFVRNHRYLPPAAPTAGVDAGNALQFPHVGGYEDIDARSRAAYLDMSRPKFLSGGGGLVGTIQDYAAFCAMLLNGGRSRSGERVIGRRTLEFMTRNHLPDGKGMLELAKPATQYSETAKNGGSFGLGFARVESPERTGYMGSVGNLAWGGAAATIFWCDPVEDLYVVFFSQVVGMQPANMLRAKLASFVYAALD
jgi:CubicO group peptidase (beta-lactamase class C family)